MTDEAIRALESTGKVMWADGEGEDELIEKVRNANAKVVMSEYFKITSRVMDASQVLKGIVVWGVGYDHVDVEAASERGIYVANTRGSNAESVAEHAFALMLGLSRKLLRTEAFVRKGGWVSREEAGLPHELIAHDLSEKTLGIVGLGAIGSRVARIAHGFNMRVLAYDPYVSVEAAKEKRVKLIGLEKLLMESDFVTLHMVLTEETKCMIGTRELNLMKPTAYLINASRGPIVDAEALVRALREKKIAGAGLDVFTKEPIDLENPLLKLDNVVVTPHCAGNSEEALKATSMMVSQEAVRILHDEVPRNLVNRSQLIERGYLR
jgi:D-3-phosphoglycerate dehydrogenase